MIGDTHLAALDCLSRMKDLSTFASNSTCELHVLRHDRDALRVNRTKVGIFKETNHVRFCRFLKRHDRGGLKSQVCLEFLCNLPHKSLKGKLADEELRRFLVATNLSKRNRTRTVAVLFQYP